MDICTHCGLPRREDETLQQTQLADGTTATICTDCRYRAAGQDPPLRTYGPWPAPPLDPAAPPLTARQRWEQEQNNPIPDVGDGLAKRKLRVCGICRQAVRVGTPENLIFRVALEDLSDDGWRAYQHELGAAQASFDQWKAATEAAYAEAIKPELEEKARALAAAEQAYRDAFDAAELSCRTEAELKDKVPILQANRDAMVNQAELAFKRMTGPNLAILDAAMYKAGVTLRQEMRHAHDRASYAFLAAPASVAAGVYSVCTDCHAKYKPRIRDRLIRERILSPSQEIPDDYLL